MKPVKHDTGKRKFRIIRLELYNGPGTMPAWMVGRGRRPETKVRGKKEEINVPSRVD